MIFWYIYGIVMILIWIIGAVLASEEIGGDNTFMMMVLIGATWLPVLILGLLVFLSLRHSVPPPPQRGEELFANLKTNLFAHQCHQHKKRGLTNVKPLDV